MQEAVQRHGPTAELARALALLDEVTHFRGDQKTDALAPAQATHPVGALREIPQRGVFAHGQQCLSAHRLLDVHARRVYVIVEGEALAWCQAALRQVHHLVSKRTMDMKEMKQHITKELKSNVDSACKCSALPAIHLATAPSARRRSSRTPAMLGGPWPAESLENESLELRRVMCYKVSTNVNRPEGLPP